MSKDNFSFAKKGLPLSMSGIEKFFGEESVLRGASINLGAGSITGLLGRNGSGKSTLIRTAVGLLKPDSGKTLLFGCPAWDCPASVRQRIGYVPQMFDAMAWLRVHEALSLVGSFYPSWDWELIERYQEQWDVPRKTKIGKLSGGQRQKVSILLAIGHRPELLVLDEPVASLDPVARQDFLRALLQMNDELNQTILFSSHITTDIERVAADVAFLHHGQIVYHGGLDDLKEEIQCLYLRGDMSLLEQNPIDGLISSRVDGNRVQVWVRDWNEAKSELLGEQIGVPVHVEAVGLEELFAGMTS